MMAKARLIGLTAQLKDSDKNRGKWILKAHILHTSGTTQTVLIPWDGINDWRPLVSDLVETMDLEIELDNHPDS